MINMLIVVDFLTLYKMFPIEFHCDVSLDKARIHDTFFIGRDETYPHLWRRVQKTGNASSSSRGHPPTLTIVESFHLGGIYDP